MSDSLLDEIWLLSMKEELIKFKRNNVWDLVLRPLDKIAIDARWVFKNKMDENGVITRSKGRFVAKGYSQSQVIDYEKTYAHVSLLEVVRLILAFACFLDFKLFQMDVKYAFLNNYINEELYVSQPLGFEDHDNPNHVLN